MLQVPTDNPVNDPQRAGQVATRKYLFGEYHRYAVAPVHTRFDRVSWFVWDAHMVDEVTGGPAVIRQEDTAEAALADWLKPCDCRDCVGARLALHSVREG